jgi:EAL domain-containing protein (putative c-di-GMP-specific phosphodiesterase class I)
VIENTPLSGRLTYWVIDAVAAELGAWLSEHEDAYVSINVPPEILGRGGLEYAAVRSGLRAHVDQIVLEITERGVPDRLGVEAINTMAEHGVRIALDDTMLSGANLALLSRCHFSIIKLDREITMQLIEHQSVPEWLVGLESLLSNSSLLVIAEGVESEYQARMLSAAGVQMAQGICSPHHCLRKRSYSFTRSHPQFAEVIATLMDKAPQLRMSKVRQILHAVWDADRCQPVVDVSCWPPELMEHSPC